LWLLLCVQLLGLVVGCTLPEQQRSKPNWAKTISKSLLLLGLLLWHRRHLLWRRWLLWLLLLLRLLV
jgi:hypothetical protein